MEKRKKEFMRICRDIKSVKIQGARNIAKAALYAYSLFPTKKTEKILLGLRPTEPMLLNTLRHFKKLGMKAVLAHFDEAQEKINKLVMKIIKNSNTIFTHCHSTNVVNALIYAKKHGKKFSVYNTETRPLYQGRKTARELGRTGIKVTTIVDAAAREAIKKSSLIMLGCDAILKNGNVINKIGSAMYAQIAFDFKIPVYIVADSWKFSLRSVKMEERQHKEVWENAPAHIKIRNPAFEIVEAKFIKAIISELGILKPTDLLKKLGQGG